MNLSEPTNGEILKQARDKIQKAISVSNGQSETTILEVLDLIVLFMQSDHPKTQSMYVVFRPALWAAGIIVATFLTLAVSGRVEIFIR